eukprot:TRINITY_DN1669_c0_g1_i1.p1 TRINITY_DN1669_c0_g1~~TRINITY_DN1669_c0_g1_i1.p1  ORF type:complete len:197 (-),score=61.20 TRINITY_DN1669_c0_g1_i1:9-599(-)
MANFEPLLHLLKAEDRRVVDALFKDVHRFRYEAIPDEKKQLYQSTLQLTPAEFEQLVRSVGELIQEALYEPAADEEQEAARLVGLFPADFHPALRQLICKILAGRAALFRESALNSLISPPSLMDFEWRVDVKTSSNLLSRMSVPTVFVSMKVQDVPTEVDSMPGTRDVNFELSKQALQTMLDGLTKIRDQLSSIK